MVKADLLYVFLVGFLGGVGYGSMVQVTWALLLLVVCICAALSLCEWMYWQKWKEGNTAAIALCGLLLVWAFGCGMLRVYITQQLSTKAYDHEVGHEIEVIGIVSEEPVSQEKGMRMVIDTDKARFITTADPYPVFMYGDQVQVSGIIKKPERVDDGNGRSFNYPSYLAKDAIFYVIQRPHLTLLSHHKGWWVKEKLFAFKQRFLSYLGHAIKEPEAALAGGLVVGAKQSLGKELEDNFRRAGIIHIVVLSGFNITIVAVAIMKMLSFLSPKVRAMCGVLGLILFAILVGGGATVVRSTLMTFLAIIADQTRRDSNVLRSLCIAGIMMVLHNPLILMFDPSFELSFLATLGLILVSPYVQPLLTFVPQTMGLQEIAVATIATQIFVLPYLLFQIGDLSIVGLFVNFLVLPCVPLTMLMVFLCGTLGFIYAPLSLCFGYISYFLLKYELSVVNFFAHLPFASLSVGYFPWWMLIVCYSVYAIILFILYKKRKHPGRMDVFLRAL